MIDLSVEIPLTLLVACRLAQLRRNGRAPHIASMHRWVNRGCRGIALESVVIAGARCTTSEAVDRWISALTAAADGQPAPVRTPARRQRAHDRANAQLEKENW